MFPLRSTSLILALSALWLSAQVPTAEKAIPLIESLPSQGDLGRLMKEIQDKNRLRPFIEELCDVVGPRLSGSEAMKRAADWAAHQLTIAGADLVRIEPYPFGLGWTRGQASAKLLSHSSAPLRVDQIGWTPGTQGPVKGDLVLVAAQTPEEIEKCPHSLQGKIVLLDDPDIPKRPLKGVSTPLQMGALERSLAAAAKKKGALALFRMSPRRNALTSTFALPIEANQPPISPMALLPQGSYRMLVRLLKAKERVCMELNLGGSFSESPVQDFNVVAEIRGSELPEEIVILGGHLDSWDLGPGATDNGTGCAVAVETLRAIKASGLKPRRTLRIVLWGGEEQGFIGSNAYVQAHRQEIPQIQAVLVHDLGTGGVKGLFLHGREDLKESLAKTIQPLKGLGVSELPSHFMPFSDHVPFADAGVPAFLALQHPLDYFSATFHSQTDTPEHLVQEHLVQGTMAMAGLAWELSKQTERLPYRHIHQQPAGK